MDWIQIIKETSFVADDYVSREQRLGLWVEVLCVCAFFGADLMTTTATTKLKQQENRNYMTIGIIVLHNFGLLNFKSI